MADELPHVRRDRELAELAQEIAARDGIKLEDAIVRAVHERPDLYRRHVDQVWQAVLVAENNPPGPDVSDDDRRLARTAMSHAAHLIGLAAHIEAGDGDTAMTTIGERPLPATGAQTMRQYLRSAVHALENRPAYRAAAKLSTDDMILFVTPRIRDVLKRARRLWRWCQEVLKVETWKRERAAVEAEIRAVVEADVSNLAAVPRDRVAPALAAAVRAMFVAHGDGGEKPSDVVISVVATLLDVDVDRVREGAKKHAPTGFKPLLGVRVISPSGVSAVSPPLQIDRLYFRLVDRWEAQWRARKGDKPMPQFFRR